MDISAQIPPPDAPQAQLSVPEARQLTEQARSSAMEALILASRPLAPEQADAGGSYRLRMQLGRDIVEVSARHNFPEGTKLLVRALGPSRIRVEQVLEAPQPRPPAALGEALRASLPRQLPMRDALQQIQTLARGETGLSSEVRAAIARLMEIVPRAEGAQQPEGLRRAIRNSGLFFEAGLRQGVADTAAGTRGPVAPVASTRPGGGSATSASLGADGSAPRGEIIGGTRYAAAQPAIGAIAPTGVDTPGAGRVAPGAPSTLPLRAPSAESPGSHPEASIRPASRIHARSLAGNDGSAMEAQQSPVPGAGLPYPGVAHAPPRRLAGSLDGLLSLLRLIQRPAEPPAAAREATTGSASPAPQTHGAGSRGEPASLYDARGRVGASAPGPGALERPAGSPASKAASTAMPPAPPGTANRPHREQAGTARSAAAAPAAARRPADASPTGPDRRPQRAPSTLTRAVMDGAAIPNREDTALDTKARLMALLALLRPGTQWPAARGTTRPASSGSASPPSPSPAGGLYTPRGMVDGAPSGTGSRGLPPGTSAADTTQASVQTANQEGRNETVRAQQLQETLARYVEGALARTRIHQVNSLPESRSAPDTGALAAWVVEVPLARGDGFDALEMRIEDHGQQHDADGRPARIWQVMLRLEVEETGPMHAFLQLAGTRLAATLWAERAATLQSARAALGELESCLEAEGVQVTRLDCIPGRPDAGPSRRFDRLLDIRT